MTVTGENISLVSADGEGNLRDNEGSGISVMANNVSIAAIEKEGKLKEKGKVDIKAMNIEVATGGETDQKYEEGELTTATYTADGDFTLRSKNITIEGVDYEVAEKKRKEKALTADSRIKLRAKTVEVSTEASANIEVDDTGALTKANYTAEGDFILRTKTVTVESVDYDLENGEKKEKALTAEGKVSVRAEKMDLAATDTEGKATGSINVNAKAVAVKTMDVDKDSKADSALAAGSTMVLVSEKMFVGAKTKDVKSKKVQVVSEEVGAFADKTLEIQQGDGKALVQLEGGNFSASGSKTQLYGETTVNAKTEIKGEFKAPKITGDDIQAKSHFKSTNIEDGMAAGGGGGGGSLSAKLQTEDAPASREDPDIRSPSGPDTGKGPDRYSPEHDTLRTEAVDENPRYRVHDRVAEKENIDDPCIFEIADLEMLQNLRFKDRQELPVQIIADNGKEHQGNDHPFSRAWI